MRMKTVALIGVVSRMLTQFSYKWFRPNHHLSIDEICRRPRDSEGFPFGFFIENQFCDRFVFQAHRKFLEIKPDFFSNLFERGSRVMMIFPSLLPLKNQVKKWPKFSLPGGTLCIAGTGQGMFFRCKGKVFDVNIDLFGMVMQILAQKLWALRTVRSLKIQIFDNTNRRISVPFWTRRNHFFRACPGRLEDKFNPANNNKGCEDNENRDWFFWHWFVRWAPLGYHDDGSWLFILSLNFWEQWKVTVLRESRIMGSPVWGFLPFLAHLNLTWNLPKPDKSTSSPSTRRSLMISRRASTSSVARFLFNSSKSNSGNRYCCLSRFDFLMRVFSITLLTISDFVNAIICPDSRK